MRPPAAAAACVVAAAAVAVAAASAGPTPSPTNATGTAPNVIWVVADDLGWADIQFNGSPCNINTPNLNALAKQGVVLQVRDGHGQVLDVAH
jgi:hypothetical protein